MSRNMVRDMTLLLVLSVGLIGCGDEPGQSGSAGNDGSSASPPPAAGPVKKAPDGDAEMNASQLAAIRRMQEKYRTAKKAIATPPPPDVAKKLVGAWRIDAVLSDGEWTSMRQAGETRDLEFRADGTLQSYEKTIKWDGVYQTSPGDDCTDLLITLGKGTQYTYACSVAFEGNRMLITSWQRTEFLRRRLTKSVDHARQEGAGLLRYYRVKEFLVVD